MVLVAIYIDLGQVCAYFRDYPLACIFIVLHIHVKFLHRVVIPIVVMVNVVSLHHEIFQLSVYVLEVADIFLKFTGLPRVFSITYFQFFEVILNKLAEVFS